VRLARPLQRSAADFVASAPNHHRLSDRAESAVLADWLADGFEPVRRPTPQTAVEEMRSRSCDVLIGEASVNGRPPLRRRAPAPRGHSAIWWAIRRRRGETVTSQPMYSHVRSGGPSELLHQHGDPGGQSLRRSGAAW
jgi:hypothetical protein